MQLPVTWLPIYKKDNELISFVYGINFYTGDRTYLILWNSINYWRAIIS